MVNTAVFKQLRIDFYQITALRQYNGRDISMLIQRIALDLRNLIRQIQTPLSMTQDCINTTTLCN